ncbi:conserved hypothetical protein [Alteromonas sp. 38]|uniref:hypothetical protein n=1 Tax=Alteromonas TaxID=226 RepID=UPI0012F05CBB|nr:MULTISPECIES: hypothetical protein [Alteromonas]CAD5292196.1 conserved hypothetical protein [Alteromonas sp. 154]VXB16997.1 conserved hypothetical protein [Alteromonas sp. 38]
MHTYLAAPLNRNVKKYDTTDFKTLLGNWEKRIVAGNNAFSQKHWLSSIALYYQAIALANQLMRVSPYRKEATVSLLVSFHNLSDTYLQFATETKPDERMGIYQMALTALCEVKNRIDAVAILLPDNPDVRRAKCIAHQQRWLLSKQHPQLATDLTSTLAFDTSSTPLVAYTSKVAASQANH